LVRSRSGGNVDDDPVREHSRGWRIYGSRTSARAGEWHVDVNSRQVDATPRDNRQQVRGDLAAAQSIVRDSVDELLRKGSAPWEVL
jgi:hypothetical protein